MGRLFSLVTLVTAGFVGGIAFVIACGSSGSENDLGPPNAHGQPVCSTYQVMITPGPGTQDIPTTMPAGWTPFGVTASNSVYLTRCAP